jgi:hypothetical protein
MLKRLNAWAIEFARAGHWSDCSIHKDPDRWPMPCDCEGLTLGLDNPRSFRGRVYCDYGGRRLRNFLQLTVARMIYLCGRCKKAFRPRQQPEQNKGEIVGAGSIEEVLVAAQKDRPEPPLPPLTPLALAQLEEFVDGLEKLKNKTPEAVKDYLDSLPQELKEI